MSSAGVLGDSYSAYPSISADGRYVAFSSPATNLMPGDSHGTDQVYLRDRVAGTTTCLSVSADGAMGSAQSTDPSISADGHVVAFWSWAPDLVPGDTNANPDVFVRDLRTGTTERVSVSTAGIQAAGGSWYAALSGDGRYVAFRSAASNLVPGDTNARGDVFVHDRVAGSTERVSLASDGSQANGNSFTTTACISRHGRYVVFQSDATNLSAADVNGTLVDVFVHDRLTGVTEMVSVSSAGVGGDNGSRDPAISADGSSVVFETRAANLVAGVTTGGWDEVTRIRW